MWNQALVYIYIQESAEVKFTCICIISSVDILKIHIYNITLLKVKHRKMKHYSKSESTKTPQICEINNEVALEKIILKINDKNPCGTLSHKI